MNIYEHIAATCGCIFAVLVVIWLIWGTIAWIVNEIEIWSDRIDQRLNDSYTQGYSSGKAQAEYEYRQIEKSQSRSNL